MSSRYSTHSGQIWKSNLSKHGFQSAYGSQIMCVTIGYHIGAFRHVKSTHRTRLSRDKKRDKFVTGDFAFLSQCNNCGMDRIRLKRCPKTLCIMGNQYWVLVSWYAQVLLPWQIRWQIRWQICHRRIGRPDLGLLRVDWLQNASCLHKSIGRKPFGPVRCSWKASECKNSFLSPILASEAPNRLW